MYDTADSQRWVDEPSKSPGRTAFQRDRARVLHSAALRRLAAKTQVHVAFESDFPRTRLTHSLECAQIGRELGASLGADPDLVEAACLAHDLGHPPFGHNGEQAIDEAARDCGGFEGNAQSLRILTRLEAKLVRDDDSSAGLNLTRATLDAATKYPWTRCEGTRKFGVYDDDVAVFTWFREGAPGERQSLEAQIMDWADDVAYSVHDLEDSVQSGDLDLRVLTDADERRQLFALCSSRYAKDADTNELDAALDRLLGNPTWPTQHDGSQRALAGLKSLTSQLIGRFCSAAESATRDAFGQAPLTRYDADLIVPRDVRLECAVLKSVTARYVMESPGSEVRYQRERDLVGELVALVSAQAHTVLDPMLRPSYESATSEAARLRVVVDHVASLTDTSAIELHRRLSKKSA